MATAKTKTIAPRSPGIIGPDIFDRELEQGEPRSGNEKPAQVEPRRRRGAKILHQPQRQYDAENADRQVQIKYSAPREIGRDKAADDRTHRGADHRRDRYSVHCRDEV